MDDQKPFEFGQRILTEVAGAEARLSRLTPMQRKVMEMLSDGMPKREVARKHQISVKTIEKHRSHALLGLDLPTTLDGIKLIWLARLKRQVHSTN